MKQATVRTGDVRSSRLCDLRQWVCGLAVALVGALLIPIPASAIAGERVTVTQSDGGGYATVTGSRVIYALGTGTDPITGDEYTTGAAPADLGIDEDAMSRIRWITSHAFPFDDAAAAAGVSLSAPFQKTATSCAIKAIAGLQPCNLAAMNPSIARYATWLVENAGSIPLTSGPRASATVERAEGYTVDDTAGIAGPFVLRMPADQWMHRFAYPQNGNLVDQNGNVVTPESDGDVFYISYDSESEYLLSEVTFTIETWYWEQAEDTILIPDDPAKSIAVTASKVLQAASSTPVVATLAPEPATPYIKDRGSPIIIGGLPEDLPVWCIEAVRSLPIVGQKYREVPIEEASFTNQFRFPEVRGKVSWVIANGYPSVSLDTLSENSGVEGITAQEAADATKYAVWSLTDGIGLKVPSGVVQQLVHYLTSHAVELHPNSADGSLAIERAETFSRTPQLVGPLTMQAPGASNITVTATGGRIVDAAGDTLETVGDGSKFFIVPESDAEIALSTAANYVHVPATVFVPVDPSLGSQTLFGGPTLQKLTASLTIEALEIAPEEPAEPKEPETPAKPVDPDAPDHTGSPDSLQHPERTREGAENPGERGSRGIEGASPSAVNNFLAVTGARSDATQATVWVSGALALFGVIALALHRRRRGAVR